MKKIIWVLLGVSLLGNVWLLFRSDAPAASVAATTAAGKEMPAGRAATAGSPARDKSAGVKSASAEPGRIAALLKGLVEMDENDLASTRERLRALGADEAMVFAALDGVTRLNFYRLTRNIEIENIRTGWWRGNPAVINKPDWGRLAEAPFHTLMGYDPQDIVDFSSRFDFLPREKAEMLAKIAVDYRGLWLRVAEDPNSSGQAYEMTIAERRADVAKLLTPEEQAEYDVRFSDFAAQNVGRFAKMQATEPEFRAISPLLERAQQEAAAMARDSAIPPAQRASAQRAMEQRAFDELVATIGYERAADFVWSGSNIIVQDMAASTVISTLAIPNAPRVMQLAAETGMQAAAIHHDNRLSPDAKRSALLALRQATQPKLDKLLPAPDRANLDSRALGWFNGLGNGEYISFTPRLAGNTTIVYSPISITSPPRGEPPASPQLRPGQ